MVTEQLERAELDEVPAGEPTALLTPAAAYPPLSERDLALLRDIGEHWRETLDGAIPGLSELPVDPTLRTRPPARWRGRFVPVHVGGRSENVAISEHADRTALSLGQKLRRAIVGPPLHSAAVAQERMRKLIALPVLSSDALSSVAYGPEAMLSVLVLAGGPALGLSLPIAGAIALLMLLVGVSYRQTIRAYPRGGGSYIVASDNLGYVPGLFAAAGLMLDYVLTVAISIASGVAAITSALPGLRGAHLVLGVSVIALLVAGNLRGIRQGGRLFAAPTHLFIAAMYLLIAAGLIDAARRGFHPLAHPPVAPVAGLGLLLALRAFSSGATAMTGIEAISDGIPAFQPVEWRNARTTLTLMVGLLLTMFAGIAVVSWLDGILPSPTQTVLSQLAHRHLGHGLLYAYVQASTALILLLAANTAFSDFPRLLFFLARDYSAPRIFMSMGDRLAFSNGILALGLAAALIFVALGGSVAHLIPLYAVGVFLAFSLSQIGMVVHWWRGRQPGWRVSIIFNGLGAMASVLVLAITAITKFTEGAWIVVILVPLLVLLCVHIRRHYELVGRAVALHPLSEHPQRPLLVPRRISPAAVVPAASVEQEEAPDEIRHLTVVPVLALDLASLRALAYATSLGQPVLAVHISPETGEAERFRHYWQAWGDHVPLEIIVSPYRALVAPLASYLQALHEQRPDLVITVVLPELVVRRRWQELLHHHVGARLRRALRPLPGLVVTTVPFHVPA